MRSNSVLTRALGLAALLAACTLAAGSANAQNRFFTKGDNWEGYATSDSSDTNGPASLMVSQDGQTLIDLNLPYRKAGIPVVQQGNGFHFRKAGGAPGARLMCDGSVIPNADGSAIAFGRYSIGPEGDHKADQGVIVLLRMFNWQGMRGDMFPPGPCRGAFQSLFSGRVTPIGSPDGLHQTDSSLIGLLSIGDTPFALHCTLPAVQDGAAFAAFDALGMVAYQSGGHGHTPILVLEGLHDISGNALFGFYAVFAQDGSLIDAGFFDLVPAVIPGT